MAYDSRQTLGLSTPLDEIPDAPVLPKGHVYGVIRRHEIRHDVPTKLGPLTFVDFHVGLTRPASDIDPAKLEGIDLTAMELRRSYGVTPNASAMLAEFREFLRSFKFSNSKLPLEALLPETTGREVLCAISPGTFKGRGGRDVAVTNLDDMVAVPAEPVTDLSATR